MKKNLFLFVGVVLICNLCFSKEKIITENEYPDWIEDFIDPSDNYDKIHFGENEILDKITKDGKYIFVYSHDKDNHYKCSFDKNGNPIKNEAFCIEDDAIDFISEFYEKAPYGRKSRKLFFYDEDRKLIRYLELFYNNDTENHIHQINDTSEGSFEFRYNNDGNYTKTCTRLGQDTDNIFSYLGSVSYYDKEGNLLSCFTNDENGRWRYFPESKEFSSFIKKYEVRYENDDIYLETYKSGYQELYNYDAEYCLVKIWPDGEIRWYDENENIIHGKNSEDEWWNTFQNGRIIYQKAKSGDTYWDYDEKGNVILKKRKSEDSWYIDENKYDEKDRLVWSFTKQVDEDEKVFSTLQKELEYDNDNFVTYVKWKTNINYEGDGWCSTVNGYRFTNIKGTVEYKFERINDNQIKVFPLDGKHWFIVNIQDEE